MSVFEVTEEQKVKVLESIGKTSKTFETDIGILREWVKTQAHLPEITSDPLIGGFLIVSKGSLEVAKKKIDMYYTIRSFIPEIFENLNPKLPENVNYRKVGKMVPFPKLTPELYRVILSSPHGTETVMKAQSYIISVNIINEIRMHEDFTLGDIYILDCKGFSLADLKTVTPKIVVNAMAVVENVFSGTRLKGIYLINSSSYVSPLVSMLKPIMKPKIFDRIKVLERGEDLKLLFPEAILPEDFGGKEISLEKIWEKFLDKLDHYQDRFDELDKLRVNEDLRPDKLKNDEILGYYGNFKKLDVD